MCKKIYYPLILGSLLSANAYALVLPNRVVIPNHVVSANQIVLPSQYGPAFPYGYGPAYPVQPTIDAYRQGYDQAASQQYTQQYNQGYSAGYNRGFGQAYRAPQPSVGPNPAGYRRPLPPIPVLPIEQTPPGAYFPENRCCNRVESCGCNNSSYCGCN
jgi:hypothetical protein